MFSCDRQVECVRYQYPKTQTSPLACRCIRVTIISYRSRNKQDLLEREHDSFGNRGKEGRKLCEEIVSNISRKLNESLEILWLLRTILRNIETRTFCCLPFFHPNIFFVFDIFLLFTLTQIVWRTRNTNAFDSTYVRVI